MNQGDIYWYTFKVPDKRRPVLILTRNSAIPFLHSVTVAPITGSIRNIPTEIPLTQADGLFQECAVNVDNIQTIQKSKLETYITRLSIQEMKKVRAAVSFAFGFDALD